ncbi:MAG: hypothetical protein ABI273_06730 [Lacunisphaera sp.]
MLLTAPLRQLSLLTGADLTALPRPEMLIRIRQRFSFLGAKHPAAVCLLLDAVQRYARLSTEDIRKITCEVAYAQTPHAP